MDRTESLSMLLSVDRVPEDINSIFVKQVSIAPGTSNIRFTFNDGSQVDIARAEGGEGELDYVVSGTLDSQTGELTLLTNNNVTYELGTVWDPEQFSDFTGLGLFVGENEGILTFKPLLSGINADVVDGNIVLAGGKTDMSFDALAVVTENADAALTSGAWRTQPLTSIVSNIPGMTIENNSINIPKGTYHLDGRTGLYRTDQFKVRLIQIAPTEKILLEFSGFARSSTGNMSEAIGFLKGRFEITEDNAVLEFQKLANISYPYFSSTTDTKFTHRFWKLE